MITRHEASRHRRTEKRSSAAIGVTLSIVAWCRLSYSHLVESEDNDIEPTDTPQPALSEPTNQTPATNTSTATEKAFTIEQEVPEAPENFYTFYKLLISGEVPIDLTEGRRAMRL